MSDDTDRPSSTFFGEMGLGLVVGGLLIACVVVGVALTIGQAPEVQKISHCMSNASQLASFYAVAVAEKRFDPTLHGSAQILSWVGPIRRGREQDLLCPGDVIPLPETSDEVLPYHPVGAGSLRAARGLGSYAVRDFEKFPIDPKSTAKQPILCDRQGHDGRTDHHKQFLVVAFTDGSAEKMTNAELGIPDGDPIVVGPDSPSEMLRVFERP